VAETFQRCAARAIAGAKRAGTKDGSAPDDAPSPPYPSDDEPALSV